MALYISAHRGHADAVRYLLELGNSAESMALSGWEDSHLPVLVFLQQWLPETQSFTHQTCLPLGSLVIHSLGHAHQRPAHLWARSLEHSLVVGPKL